MISNDTHHTETLSLIGREVTAIVNGIVADVSVFVQRRPPGDSLVAPSEAADKLVVGLRIDCRRGNIEPISILAESGVSRQLAVALASAADVSEDLPFRFVARL